MNYIENTEYDKVGRDTYFTYNGNKLESTMTGGQWKSVYTYTGDLITKIEHYEFTNLYYTTEYTYKNNKLETRRITRKSTQETYTTYYIHNSDGSVSYSNTNSEGKYIFKDGNLINNGKEKFEYDTKNNPFKNITGIDVITLDDDNELNFNVSKNNIIKSTSVDSNNSSYSFNILKFNNDGFPIEDLGYWNDGITSSKSGSCYKYYYE